LALVIINKRA